MLCVWSGPHKCCVYGVVHTSVVCGEVHTMSCVDCGKVHTSVVCVEWSASVLFVASSYQEQTGRFAVYLQLVHIVCITFKLRTPTLSKGTWRR